MNFIKTFLITLVIYLGLNTVFMLVMMFTFPAFPMDDIIFIISLIFAPIFATPGTAWLSAILQFTITTDILTDVLTFLGFIIPPLVAVIIGARLADNNKLSFGSWFLTAIISCVVYAILIFVGHSTSSSLALVWGMLILVFGEIGAIVTIILGGVINGIFYGCFSFLFTKEGL